MRIPRSEIAISDIVEAKRVKVGRGRRGNEEVLVRFVDVETRDRIASYARNLGDYVENGRPTATFRHDIPVHLAGVHRTLMQYGFAMKMRYGTYFRKNIRFDDAARTFCIDILIPGPFQEWETVTYERALFDCKTKEKETEAQRGDAYSSTSVDGSGDVQRLASAACALGEKSPNATPMDVQRWGQNK